MVTLSNGYTFYDLLMSVSEEVSEPYLTSISFLYRFYYLLISVSEEVSEPNLTSISFIYRNLFQRATWGNWESCQFWILFSLL